MIAEAPTAAATNVDGGVLTKVDAYIQAAISAAADGLSWAEFGELLVAFLRLSVSLYDDVASMTGEEKKAAVLDGVARLFDAVADYAVPVAVYPIWIIARPAIRALILALAAGAVEQILPLVRFAR